MADQIAQGENVEGLNAERKEVIVAHQFHINIQLHKFFYVENMHVIFLHYLSKYLISYTLEDRLVVAKTLLYMVEKY